MTLAGQGHQPRHDDGVNPALAFGLGLEVAACPGTLGASDKAGGPHRDCRPGDRSRRSWYVWSPMPRGSHVQDRPEASPPTTAAPGPRYRSAAGHPASSHRDGNSSHRAEDGAGSPQDHRMECLTRRRVARHLKAQPPASHEAPRDQENRVRGRVVLHKHLRTAQSATRRGYTNEISSLRYFPLPLCVGYYAHCRTESSLSKAIPHNYPVFSNAYIMRKR